MEEVVPDSTPAPSIYATLLTPLIVTIFWSRLDLCLPPQKIATSICNTVNHEGNGLAIAAQLTRDATKHPQPDTCPLQRV
jgi:hypothetical protein